jgi:hypothetical protein
MRVIGETPPSCRTAAGATAARLPASRPAPPAVWSWAAPENDPGTWFEAAQLDDDGTLRVTGHHTRPGVSEFFAEAIIFYDWAPVSAPGQVATLLTMLGGQAGDDVPGLLAAYHDQHGGQINEPLRGPPVAATFSKLAQLTPASQDRRYLSPCGTGRGSCR